MSFIIFEGIDKAGKTTLINNLFEQQFIYHPTRPFKPYNNYSFQIKGEYLALAKINKYFVNINLILDRFIASEYVYSKLDKINKKNLNYIFKIDKQIAKNSKMIYVTANKNIIETRIKNEKLITKNDITKILAGYNEYLKLTKINYIVIDTSNNDISFCINKIINWLNLKGGEYYGKQKIQ